MGVVTSYLRGGAEREDESVPEGLSIHIGLNTLDPEHYSDGFEPLSACVNDALDMDTLAEDQGFERKLLLDAEATHDAVIGFLGNAVGSLSAGDTLLVTYSGHGGQLPDRNGDESDGTDETWCLYDRQLLDDELWRLWIRVELNQNRT